MIKDSQGHELIPCRCCLQDCRGWNYAANSDRIRVSFPVPADWQTPDNDTKKSVREQVLEESASLIMGDREASYGSPAVNFKRLADTINGTFGPTHLKKDFSSADVALILVLLKVIRQVNKSQHDNWVDIVGYGALGAEVDE